MMMMIRMMIVTISYEFQFQRKDEDRKSDCNRDESLVESLFMEEDSSE